MLKMFWTHIQLKWKKLNLFAAIQKSTTSDWLWPALQADRVYCLVGESTDK